MSLIDKFERGIKKEEVNPGAKYPIIWKSTKCEPGECRDKRITHRWAVPCSVPMGLATECYDCHKTRLVRMDSEPGLWDNIKPSAWSTARLNELKQERPDLF